MKLLEFTGCNLEKLVSRHRARSLDHLDELPILSRDASIALTFDQQLERMVKLNAAALVHHEHAVRVNHRVQSMRDNQNRGLLEALP